MYFSQCRCAYSHDCKLSRVRLYPSPGHMYKGMLREGAASSWRNTLRPTTQTPALRRPESEAGVGMGARAYTLRQQAATPAAAVGATHQLDPVSYKGAGRKGVLPHTSVHQHVPATCDHEVRRALVLATAYWAVPRPRTGLHMPDAVCASSLTDRDSLRGLSCDHRASAVARHPRARQMRMRPDCAAYTSAHGKMV